MVQDTQSQDDTGKSIALVVQKVSRINLNGENDGCQLA